MWFVSSDVSDHDCERRVLYDVRRNSNGEVRRALIHAKSQLAIYHGDLDPSVTGRDHDLSLKILVPQGVLRNPGTDHVRSDGRVFLHLFNQMFELVKRSAVNHGEVVEGGSVGPWSEVSWWETKLRTFLGGSPLLAPPVATPLLELLSGAGTVDEGQEFCDGFSPEPDFPFSDDRKTIGEEKHHWCEREESVSAHGLKWVLGVLSVYQDFSKTFPVLGVRGAFTHRQIFWFHSYSSQRALVNSWIEKEY